MNDDMSRTSPHKVVTLNYNDLQEFDPSNPNDSMVRMIEEAFGPDGLGILTVEGVPKFSTLRQNLLSLAPKIPRLPDLEDCVNEASLFNSGWSHGREQLGGKPDMSKGSFYANPLVEDLAVAIASREGNTDFWNDQAKRYPSFYAPNVWPNKSLPSLQPAFVEAGKALAQTGYLVARVCDAYCQTNGVETNFYDLLSSSLNAKGRLLHYFDATSSPTENSDNWCAWHNDHGSLTGLLPGLYHSEEGKVVNPQSKGGLHIQTRSGDVVQVAIPPTQAAFQIGETSQIQSGGLLQATPHMVSTGKNKGVTRESFAVFLEPEFTAALEIPEGKNMCDVADAQTNLPKGMVPLSKRWKPGQSFGDFHVATVSAFSTSTA